MKIYLLIEFLYLQSSLICYLFLSFCCNFWFKNLILSMVFIMGISTFNIIPSLYCIGFIFVYFPTTRYLRLICLLLFLFVHYINYLNLNILIFYKDIIVQGISIYFRKILRFEKSLYILFF